MIEIKTLKNISEFKELPRIQKSAWKFTDLDAEPHFLMTRVHKYGGLVQGLYLDGDMIGFTYALLGKWKGEIFIYSHMAAVVEEHQGKGFGFLLKKAQREGILELGYDVVRWNFDPLESLNAYFNLHRLGVISEEYERNVYGTGETGLHKGLSTDRLIATWLLKSNRVIERMEKKLAPIIVDIPREAVDDLSGDIAYIETPRDIRSIKQSDMHKAIEWRTRHRKLFESALAQGFIVEELVFTPDKDRLFFRLLKREQTNDSNQ